MASFEKSVESFKCDHSSTLVIKIYRVICSSLYLVDDVVPVLLQSLYSWRRPMILPSSSEILLVLRIQCMRREEAVRFIWEQQEWFGMWRESIWKVYLFSFFWQKWSREVLYFLEMLGLEIGEDFWCEFIAFLGEKLSQEICIFMNCSGLKVEDK